MAAMLTSNTIGDYEDKDLESQIAMAQALRKQSMETPGQMIGGFYVGKNPWLNLGEAIVGGMNEQVARGRQGTLSKSRQQAEQDWLARQPSAMMQQTKELAGPTEGGEPLMGTAEVPKPYQQLQQETQQWGTQAPVTSALGQQVRGHALTQALSLPKEQMIAEQKAEEAKQVRLEKAANEAKARQEKIEADLRRDRERAADKENLIRVAASLKSAAGGAAGNEFGGAAPVVGADPADNSPIYRHTKSGKLFKYGADGMPEVYAGTVGAKPKPESAAAEKARHEANIGVASIDDAINEIAKHPKALGIKNLLPGAERIRQETDPGGVAARAAVANIGSLKLHDRSGAAVTISEFPRLRPFIPVATDSDKAATVKLQKMKQEYERMRAEWATEKKAPGNTDVGGWKDL